MTTCVICHKETPVTCICGFCPDCISWKGHNGCVEEIRRRKEDARTKIAAN